MRRVVAVVVLMALCTALGAIDRATISMELPKYRQEYAKTQVKYFAALGGGLALAIASMFVYNPDGSRNGPVLVGGMLGGAGIIMLGLQPAFTLETLKQKIARCEYVDALYDTLSSRDADAIWTGRLYLGMPADAVEVVRGKPVQVNASVGAWGRHEQWVYGSGSYLYFEDGRLSSMQF